MSSGYNLPTAWNVLYNPLTPKLLLQTTRESSRLHR
jgi:hypothetical protein